MQNSNIFKRSEMKFMISAEKARKLQELMKEYMVSDSYGKSTILSLYYDTPDYLLIRRSLEKPDYKEKLRVRSYGVPDSQGKVYVELKKKYNSVVYKRRVSMTEEEARLLLQGNEEAQFLLREDAESCLSLREDKAELKDGVNLRSCIGKNRWREQQIIKEIEYFKHLYPHLAPRMLISYEREAFYGINDGNFRITFDQNILARNEELFLTSGVFGEKILEEENMLMEVKTRSSLPIWLVNFLSHEHIYKTSFSKYGTAYLSGNLNPCKGLWSTGALNPHKGVYSAGESNPCKGVCSTRERKEITYGKAI